MEERERTEQSAVGTRLGELLRRKGIQNTEQAQYESRIAYLEEENRALKEKNRSLTQALANCEMRIASWFEKAVQDLKAADYINAMGLLQAVLIHEPENIKAMINLAVAYAALGYSDKAREYLEQVIASDPDNEMAKKNLAILNQ